LRGGRKHPADSEITEKFLQSVSRADGDWIAYEIPEDLSEIPEIDVLDAP